jgi:N-acetylmuramoyl-L-alanine amidase
MDAAGNQRRTIRAGFLAVFALFAALPMAARATDPVVTDVRVSQSGPTTRFVLDATAPMDLRLFTLPDPDRVVIDMPEVGWKLPQRALPSSIGLLAKLRYGLFQPGNSRVVIDLTGPAAVERVFRLPPDSAYGHRIVVDLRSVPRAAFIAATNQMVAAPAMGGAANIAAPRAPAADTSTHPAAVLAALAPPHRPAAPAKRVIAIDPGHGGVDPGATGPSGLLEKDVTLSFARLLRDELLKTGRYQPVLTRDRDIFIRLRDRVRIAREAGAELFVSLHADTVADPAIRGLSVYTLSEQASDREAAALAEKENKADVIAGIDLTNESAQVTTILIDLAQRETMNQSARFAAGMVQEVANQSPLLRNTHRFAGFAVLKAPDVPSVLVELGFLSNRQDERQLKNRNYLQKLAVTTAQAVDRFFGVEEAARR